MTKHKVDWAAVWREAQESGVAAGNAHVPRPMHVLQRADPFDNNSPVIRRYAPVLGGVCGFAWIRIRPARGKLVSWLKKQRIGSRDSYAGGYLVSIRDHNQSYERKMKHAHAMASVLRQYGINAMAGGRLD